MTMDGSGLDTMLPKRNSAFSWLYGLQKGLHSRSAGRQAGRVAGARAAEGGLHQPPPPPPPKKTKHHPGAAAAATHQLSTSKLYLMDLPGASRKALAP